MTDSYATPVLVVPNTDSVGIEVAYPVDEWHVSRQDEFTVTASSAKAPYTHNLARRQGLPSAR